MSLRLQTLQVARLAANPLRESADRVTEFVRSKQHASGGFLDRAGEPDLYYTVFGLQCLIALQQEFDEAQLAGYLSGFNTDELDFVHLGALARCWSYLKNHTIDSNVRRAVLERFAAHRTPEGGFHQSVDATHGSAYGAFVALGAYQDLQEDCPNLAALAQSLEALSTGDGGYANDTDIRLGNAPGTAAVIAIGHQLGHVPHKDSARFLFSCCHPEGGFFAMPEAPMPDLLSTATALHALACLKQSIDPIRETCLDFVDTLWTSRGGFYGHWGEQEEDLDVEYTYYGLLALGHLSV